MKKVILSLFLCFMFVIGAYAGNLPDTKYSNLEKKDKISYDPSTDTWSRKIDRKNGNYFVKTKGFGDFYDYNDANGNFAFSTNCEFEFINNKNFIGYSNKDMKFYFTRIFGFFGFLGFSFFYCLSSNFFRILFY